MAKKNRHRERINTNTQTLSGQNPFAGLASMRDALPERPEAAADEKSVEIPANPMFADKVVLRFERKGHGGKSVTVLQGVVAVGESRKALIAELKRSLGTHVREVGTDIILSGDLRERAKALLEKSGAKRIVVG